MPANKIALLIAGVLASSVSHAGTTTWRASGIVDSPASPFFFPLPAKAGEVASFDYTFDELAPCTRWCGSGAEVFDANVPARVGVWSLSLSNDHAVRGRQGAFVVGFLGGDNRFGREGLLLSPISTTPSATTLDSSATAVDLSKLQALPDLLASLPSTKPGVDNELSSLSAFVDSALKHLGGTLPDASVAPSAAPVAVPEPSTFALLMMGFAATLMAAKRRQARS